MRGRWYNLTSAFLAGLYLLAASLGHALHNHDGCCNVTLDSPASQSAASTCCCGLDHGEAAQQSNSVEKDIAVVFANCEHDCAACKLISLLSLGQSHSAAAVNSWPQPSLCELGYACPTYAVSLSASAPRGPPAILG